MGSYTVGQNAMLLYLLFYSNCSRFSHQGLFQLTPRKPVTYLHSFFFSFAALSCLLAFYISLDSSCVSPALILQLAIFLIIYSSFHWRMVLETKIQMKVCLLLLGCPFFQALSADNVQKPMCGQSQIYKQFYAQPSVPKHELILMSLMDLLPRESV